MTEQELLRQFKYYNGENEPPKEFDDNKRLWWGGEKTLLEKCRDSSFWNRLKSSFKEAEKANALSGILIDSSVPEIKRIIIYFLDLWHGRFFPYNSLNEINKY